MTPSLRHWLALPHDARGGALQDCLDRIRDLEPSLQAWVQVAPQPPTGDGALSGIPFAVKDIIETRGLATEFGSPIYRGRVGAADAGVISDLRARGAVLLGKTQTTAFAYRTPAPTRNPRNTAHTPGGSSSGSAAAVAAGMVPLALGTQTQGSVLRPASYCGVAGFKPTYGFVPMDGVLPLAPSLDTLGFFAQSASDMVALWDALGRDVRAADERVVGVSASDLDVEPPMAAAFARAVDGLRTAGFAIERLNLAGMLSALNAASRVVMSYEAARVHEARYKEHGASLLHLADLIREGMAVSEADYRAARRQIDEARAQVSELYRAAPVVLVPAATGPAPLGLAFTGDARMNAPWTALGTPAISIPMRSAEGLPLGLQITADRGEDARVLRVATRIEEILDADRAG